MTNRTASEDRLFQALAHPVRRRVLRFLAREELSLKRIEKRFAISRPALLKHLRLLRACRLVKTRKAGRETLHRLDAQPLQAVRDWVAFFEAFWDARLLALKQQIEGSA
jgi:DNA-binding transcriptional ArsR family regulator